MVLPAFANGWWRLTAQVAITFALLWASTLLTLRQSKAHGDDLVQDYVAARAWLDGESPYQTLNVLRARVGFPPVLGHVHVRYNPHPPGAIIVTAPFVRADFGTALAWVRAAQLLAVALTWALAYRLFRPPVTWWLWAALGGLFGLWTPLWQGLDWGQPVGVPALAVVVLWGLARADRSFWFGLALGLACTVRPFTAMLVVLAAGWPRGRVAVTALATLLGGLIPFLLTDIWPWEWYRLASDARSYVEECGSLPGLLGIGVAGGVVLFALAACAIALARYRGLDADATAAVAAVAAMLTYPLAWFQYDVSLVAAVAWVAARVGQTGNRWALFGLAAYLLLRAVPDVIPDPQGGGAANFFALNKGWIQVAARAILLLAVLAARRGRGPVSGNAPS
jgi:hypothetical protein